MTEEDIKSALEAYDKEYYNFTISDIEALTDIRIERNKRNYLKQSDHLQVARAVRDVKVKLKGKNDWREGNGRKSKKNIIFEFMRDNPTITKKAEIARVLCIDRKTVIKYYDEIVVELQQERLRSARMEQLERDGHISVKITPLNELNEILFGDE